MARKLEESITQRGEASDTETLTDDTDHHKKSKKDKKKQQQQQQKNEESVVIKETLDSKKSKKNKRKHDELGLEKKREKKVRVFDEGTNEVEGMKGVVVTGKDTEDSKYKAFDSFADSGLSSVVLDCCKNFDKPSPIQANSWPFLLNGRDLIGIATTGSGKTLAFGVPALMHILQKDDKKASKKAVPHCLVLSPTRELAQQIADVLCDAGAPCGIKSVCLYGGTKKEPQISSLKSGVDIVIGTPGRMKDLIEMGVCRLKDVSFVVLDEADRMLDMGFEPEVRSILGQTSSVRQMVMFSATWPLAVHHLAQEFMDPNPVKVLDDRSRDARLVALLEKYHKSQKDRVLVFVLYKKEAARVESMLQRS